MRKALLVFQSDFTRKEGAVCAMYGVVKSVDRDLEILTGTHEIPRYDIWSASCRLDQYTRFWPAGTVFVSVVDPGVGTDRRACVALTGDGYYVVTPDNGTLTHLKKSAGIREVREIDERTNRLRDKGTEDVGVFHGRDLFAYCAARLAAGIIPYEAVGPDYPTADIITFPVQEPVIRDGAVSGILEIGDPNFGNLWTNIPLSLFNRAGFRYGDHLRVVIRHEGAEKYTGTVPFFKTFGSVAKGDVLMYTNELMKTALAVSQGSFTEAFGLGFGPAWTVEVEKSG